MAVAEKLKLCSATRRWDKMSREERAVALAKDVLAIVGAKKVTVDTGSYLRTKAIVGAKTKDDAREALADRQCEVCAKGALLFAKLTARNHLTLKEVGGWKQGSDVTIETGSDECVRAVSDAFDARTCHTIEAAFEGYWHYHPTTPAYISANAWYDKFADPRRRLVAIMKRVIKNNGAFTLADLANP